MIVNSHIEGWEIISQYTHGLLAGKIAMQLKHDLRPDYWEDVLTAIIEHDDQLLGFEEKDYRTDAGAPLDFTLDERSDDDAYEHAERVYRNSLQKSQMVALLIGRHLEFLYHEKTKTHSGFRKFFKNVDGNRKVQLKLYDWEKPTLEKTYMLMRFCDRCSLILCQDLIPSTQRKLEINKSIADERYFVSETEAGVHIEPWPFEPTNFSLHFETRLLKKLSFKSSKELAKAVSQTLPALKIVQLTKNTA